MGDDSLPPAPSPLGVDAPHSAPPSSNSLEQVLTSLEAAAQHDVGTLFSTPVRDLFVAIGITDWMALALGMLAGCLVLLLLRNCVRSLCPSSEGKVVDDHNPQDEEANIGRDKAVGGNLGPSLRTLPSKAAPPGRRSSRARRDSSQEPQALAAQAKSKPSRAKPTYAAEL